MEESIAGKITGGNEMRTNRAWLPAVATMMLAFWGMPMYQSGYADIGARLTRTSSEEALPGVLPDRQERAGSKHPQPSTSNPAEPLHDDIQKLIGAAENGDAKAQFELGLAYRTGKNVAQDPEKAVYWYRKAANQNNPGAYYQLGNMYENGFGVEKDIDEAHKWYSRGAELGNPGCREGLKTVEKLREWRRQGKFPKEYTDSETGIRYTVNPDSSVVYHSGDKEKLNRLQMRLAENGNVVAQLHIGLDYFHGRDGRPKDLHEARKWLSRAAKQGNTTAKEFLKKIPNR
jgi:hypothetical protein